MKKCLIAGTSLILAFAFCFLCIGYAQLTDSLTIRGEAKAVPPEGIYITSVELVSSTGGDSSKEDSGTYIATTTNVISKINTGYSNSWRNPTYTTVTYKITVWNNTSYKYSYAGLEYTNMTGYDNNSIGNNFTITTKDKLNDSSATFNESDSVEPGDTITFYAVYSASNYTHRNTELATYVNYKFGVHMDSVGDAAADRVIKQLGVILNNEETYQRLIEKIDDKFDGRDWTSNFIGNVWHATSAGHAADTELINELFGDNLKITIGQEELEVTLLIKRENVDGNTQTGDNYTAYHSNGNYTGTGCEMTLYVTTGDLQMGDSPTVYSAVYTCAQNADGTPNGDWYLLGERYEGTAQIVGYMGGAQYGGSFDTGTWRSVAGTYQPSPNYSYYVANNQTIQTITQATDGNAVRVLQSLIDDAVNVLKNSGYAGEAMVNLQEALDQTERSWSSDNTVNTNSTRSQLVQLIKDLSNHLQPFEDWLTSN